jgi:hypothetical protein
MDSRKPNSLDSIHHEIHHASPIITILIICIFALAHAALIVGQDGNGPIGWLKMRCAVFGEAIPRIEIHVHTWDVAVPVYGLNFIADWVRDSVCKTLFIF